MLTVVIFNNHEIFIKGTKNGDLKKINKFQVNTRENYIDWASEFNKNLQKNNKTNNKFKWKGFNMWWLNSLSIKVSELNR